MSFGINPYGGVKIPKNLSEIPNERGFEFIGVTPQGYIDCMVHRDSTGRYFVTDMKGRRCFNELTGWHPK